MLAFHSLRCLPGRDIQEQACQLGSQMGLAGFKASGQWLNKFRSRHPALFKDDESGDESVIDSLISLLLFY